MERVRDDRGVVSIVSRPSSESVTVGVVVVVVVVAGYVK